MNGPAALPWPVLDLLCADLDLELPYPLLQAHPAGQSEVSAADARQQAEKEGWLRRGRWEVDLEEQLRLVARSPRALTATAQLRESSFTARVAAGGGMTVRAKAEQWGVYLDMVRPTAFVLAIVELIPDCRAGAVSGSPSFPADAESGTKREAEFGFTESFLETVTPSTTSVDRQVRLARMITTKQRYRAGNFMAHAKPSGKREIDSTALGWLDTEDGRYAVVTTLGSDGRPWISYLAANNAKIIERLDELARSITH